MIQKKYGVGKYTRTNENRIKISESLKKYFSDPEVKKKLSIQNSGKRNPRYGKSWSLQQKKEMSEKKSGKNNPQWKHGNYEGKHHYTKPRDDIYHFKFNSKFKNLIRKRDNQICMLCGVHREKLKLPLAIHHIDYDKFNTIEENCVSLCFSCHAKTNVNRKSWIKFFHNVLSSKYDYNYEFIELQIRKEAT